MKTFGKKYQDMKKKLDTNKIYSLQEGAKAIVETSPTKFDATVEIAIKTHANPKYNDQNLRGTIVLPHGTGKKVRVAVFTTEDKFADAQKAGAEVVGHEDLLKNIEKGELDFDVLVTEVSMMKELAKVAKILGPK